MHSATSRCAVVRSSGVPCGLTVRVSQTLAIQLGIKEAVLPTGTASGATDRDFDLRKLRDVLERCGIVITERKPSKLGPHRSRHHTYSIGFLRRICGKDCRGGSHTFIGALNNGSWRCRGFHHNPYAVLVADSVVLMFR
jgi:hypothetical protein